MKYQIEQYTQLPETIRLPRGIHAGLESLWKKSAATQTEWVGATVHTSNKYQVLPLGRQSAGRVKVPIVNLALNAVTSHKILDERFIREECVTSEWDIRCVPNQEGDYYQGAILYLLPRNTIPSYTELFLSVLSPKDRVLPEEEFSGIAHSHPLGALSYLPSLRDTRHFVFGSLPIFFEHVVSDENVSLLVKSKDAIHFQSHPERSNHLNTQELTDNLELEEGRPYLEVLQNNCKHYKLGLYSGKLNSVDPLTPFF